MTTEAPRAPDWYVPGWLRDASDPTFLARVPQEPEAEGGNEEKEKSASSYVHREMRNPGSRPAAPRIPPVVTDDKE